MYYQACVQEIDLSVVLISELKILKVTDGVTTFFTAADTMDL